MRRFIAFALLSIAGTAVGEERKFSLKVSEDLSLYGSLTGAYFRTNNPDQDRFNLTNSVIGISGETGKDIRVGFDLAVGSLLMPTVWDGGQGDPQRFDFTQKGIAREGFGFLWGYLTVKPGGFVSVDFGIMPTNVGYEVANTYANPNITLGTTWFAQPVIYPAVRVTFSGIEGVDLYAEYNQEFDLDNFTLGVLGELGGVSFALSYYDYKSFKNLVDLVLSYSLGKVDVGLNFDYQWLDDPQAGQDESAFGLALYAVPKFGRFSVPVRVEYFSEGTSGIYSGGNADKGYTLTITPTFKPAGNTFLRAEVAYISTDGSVFENGTKDSRTTLGVELGFTF
ncbi:MAG: outer membrane beta-barrel protein [Aquificota bacterium]|nr:outer membrane beta-barrel protein [Aquificota bacterium]